MPRPGLTPAFIAAISAPVIRPAFFIRAQFKTDWFNTWTGTYDLTWGAITYHGTGSALGITGISEDTTVEAKGVTLSLSGVPSDLLGDCLNEFVRGYPAQVYLGLFEADGVTLVPDPVLAYSGRLDQPTLNDAGDACTISIAIENALVDMNRSVYRRYTDADQQLDHPGDLGCQFVPSIQEVTTYFGSLPLSQNN